MSSQEAAEEQGNARLREPLPGSGTEEGGVGSGRVFGRIAARVVGIGAHGMDGEEDREGQGDRPGFARFVPDEKGSSPGVEVAEGQGDDLTAGESGNADEPGEEPFPALLRPGGNLEEREKGRRRALGTTHAKKRAESRGASPDGGGRQPSGGFPAAEVVHVARLLFGTHVGEQRQRTGAGKTLVSPEVSSVALGRGAAPAAPGKGADKFLGTEGERARRRLPRPSQCL